MNNSTTTVINRISARWFFLVFWLLTFVIYIATARAGWVIDGVGFLYNMKHQGFWDFINRTYSQDQSFYQVLTLHYYIFYKIWGFNPWMWGLLYITIHALNVYLLFLLSKNILSDSGVGNSRVIALAGALLFIVAPHISEILVCRAYYHYLQCFLFILLILYWVQKYQHKPRPGYIIGSLVLFALSVFTLEVFYIIPLLVLAIALYYHFVLGIGKKIFKKTILFFVIGQILLLFVYFLALFARYKHLTPHKIEINQGPLDYLTKLPKYFFHIVLLGRYFSAEVKDKVYAMCGSGFVIIIFYGLIVYYFVYFISRFNTISNYGKAIFLFFILALINVAFLTPLPFPDSSLEVFYDRYTYFTDAFVYILLAMILAKYVKNKYIIIGLFCVYVDFNLYFTIQVNTYWIQSDAINNQLLRNFPDCGNKTVLLLNNPENMNGAPMIGAQPEGIFKGMLEIYTGRAVPNTIYDVASYNMNADYNGAHVTVINDTTLMVVLNHGGTWWWYEGHGAVNYETPDYKTDFKTVGMRYDITLKRPAGNYLILFSVGDKWKTVDMSLKNKQQD